MSNAKYPPQGSKSPSKTGQRREKSEAATLALENHSLATAGVRNHKVDARVNKVDAKVPITPTPKPKNPK